jgi:hypothetical protein
MADGNTANGIQGLLGAAGGLAYASEITKRGQGYAQEMGELAGTLQNDAAFKGYGVNTGLANSTIRADGTLDLGIGQDKTLDLYGKDGYRVGMRGFKDANNMLQANASNPAYQQAMGMYGANSSNSQMGNSINQLSQAGNMLNANAANSQMGNALAAQQGGMGGISAQQQGMLNASNAMMQQSMQGQAGREQDIYGRAMAMQQPMLDQQRAQMNAREFAQGRSGIRGSQFGGTGEDAAMARAQAQAQNSAAFQSMGMAQQEQMQQANIANMYGGMGQGAAGLQGSLGMNMGNLGLQNAQLGQGAAGQLSQNANMLNQFGLNQAQLGQSAAQGMGGLGLSQAQLGQSAGQAMSQNAAQQAQMGLAGQAQSYLGMQNQLQALQAGQHGANMAQTGQLTGTGYAAQLGLGGVQTAVNADKAAGELYGNVAAAMMNNANGKDGASSWLGDIFDF